MDSQAQEKPERSYDVRIKSEPKVQAALNIEQNNRHKAVNYKGRKPRLVDILADWVEEKADSIIQQDTPI